MKQFHTYFSENAALFLVFGVMPTSTDLREG